MSIAQKTDLGGVSEEEMGKAKKLKRKIEKELSHLFHLERV